MSVLIIAMGITAVILLVTLVIYGIHRKALIISNLVMALTLFLARSCFIYYVRHISNAAIPQNKETLEWVDNSLAYLLGWVIVSAVAVLIFNVMVPFIHTHFAIVRTPPGQPDKVIKIDVKTRKSA